MNVTLKRFPDLCCLQEFKINDIPAEYQDFGCTEDKDIENSPEGGCSNRQFVPDEHIEDRVLKKYRITQQEAEEIQEMLIRELSMGKCSFCGE